MLSEKRTFTSSEAAVVSGVAVKTVHREIDDGPLKSKSKEIRRQEVATRI